MLWALTGSATYLQDQEYQGSSPVVGVALESVLQKNTEEEKRTRRATGGPG